MNILIVNDTFSVGGAEIFSARLAQAFYKAGHNVWLYSIHNGQHINQELLAHNAPDVPLITFNSKSDWLIEKATSVCRRLKIDFNPREFIVTRHLQKFIKENNIEVAHAHMFISDYILSFAKTSEVAFTRVATMHGTHEGFLHNYIYRHDVIIPDYITKLNKCLSSLNGIVYGTDRNIYFLKDPVVNQDTAKRILTRQIYNGFEAPPVTGEITRQKLGIKESDTVFTFIARGIPAKGWPLVIEAFKRLNRSDSHLILIGDNEYVQKLKVENKQYTNMHFVGFQMHANEWINLTDIGLLPTTYGESIPTVIVEFLSQGKPMIVTDVAECANMITADNQYAGFVINTPKDKEGFVLPDYQINPDELKQILVTYCDNPKLLQAHRILAHGAFQKFAMDICVKQHINFYEAAIQSEKSPY